MVPQNISLSDHYKGDTFKGLTFVLKKNKTPIDLTDCEIRCQFVKNNSTEQQVLTLDDYIEITDAVNGLFRINPLKIDWPASLYFFDIEFTFPDGIVQTYVKGTLTIQNDITKN